MRKNENSEMVVRTFSDVSDMVSYATSAPMTNSVNRAHGRQNGLAGLHDATHFGMSLFAALEQARTGWKEGAKRAKEASKGVNIEMPALPSYERKRVQRDNGPRLLINKFIQHAYGNGDEKIWERSMQVRTPEDVGDIVTIVINGALTANFAADAFFWQAACAAILCDLLEEAGRRVEIVAGFGSDSSVAMVESPGGYKSHVVLVTLKEADAPLDLNRILSIGHESMFRGIVFRIRLQEPQEIHPAMGSAWAASRPYEDVKARYFRAVEFSRPELREEDLVLVSGQVTMEKAIEFLETQVAKFSGEEED